MMSPNDPRHDESLARLAVFARQTLQSQSTLAKQSLELTRAALSGELDWASAGKAYVEAVNREGARYWRAVGELGADHAGDLVALAHQPAPGHDGATSEGAGRHVAVTLRGPLGGRAEGPVTVANRHPRPRRVELSGGDVTDASGRPVGAAVEVVPPRVTVPAGQDRAVTVGVELSADLFAAGGCYTATVEVSGGDEATLDVRVEVAG